VHQGNNLCQKVKTGLSCTVLKTFIIRVLITPKSTCTLSGFRWDQVPYRFTYWLATEVWLQIFVGGCPACQRGCETVLWHTPHIPPVVPQPPPFPPPDTFIPTRQCSPKDPPGFLAWSTTPVSLSPDRPTPPLSSFRHICCQTMAIGAPNPTPPRYAALRLPPPMPPPPHPPLCRPLQFCKPPEAWRTLDLKCVPLGKGSGRCGLTMDALRAAGRPPETPPVRKRPAQGEGFFTLFLKYQASSLGMFDVNRHPLCLRRRWFRDSGSIIAPRFDFDPVLPHVTQDFHPCCARQLILARFNLPVGPEYVAPVASFL